MSCNVKSRRYLNEKVVWGAELLVLKTAKSALPGSDLIKHLGTYLGA